MKILKLKINIIWICLGFYLLSNLGLNNFALCSTLINNCPDQSKIECHCCHHKNMISIPNSKAVIKNIGCDCEKKSHSSGWTDQIYITNQNNPLNIEIGSCNYSNYIDFTSFQANNAYVKPPPWSYVASRSNLKIIRTIVLLI